METAYTDSVFAFARLGNGVGSLHSHERVHLDAEGLFEAEGHIAGEIGAGVQQTRQSRTRYLESRGGGGDRKAGGLNNLGPDEITGMRRVLHGNDVHSFPASGNLPNSNRIFHSLS